MTSLTEEDSLRPGRVDLWVNLDYLFAKTLAGLHSERTKRTDYERFLCVAVVDREVAAARGAWKAIKCCSPRATG